MLETRVKIWCVVAMLTLAAGGFEYARLPATSPEQSPRPKPAASYQAPSFSPQHRHDLSI